MRKSFTLLYGIATGACGVSNPTVSILTNLNDSGTGSFRDVVSGITAGPESSKSPSIEAIASTGQFDLLTAELNANRTVLVKYRLKPEVSGMVELNVILTDNGGTEFGGINKISKKVILQVAALPNLQIASNKTLNIGLGQSITLTASGGSNYTWQRPF